MGDDPLVKLFLPGVACEIADVSYRQLQYWDATGLLRPSYRVGIASQRRYTVRDMTALAALEAARRAGISIQKIRSGLESVRYIQNHGVRSDFDLFFSPLGFFVAMPSDEFYQAHNIESPYRFFRFEDIGLTRIDLEPFCQRLVKWVEENGEPEDSTELDITG